MIPRKLYDLAEPCTKEQVRLPRTHVGAIPVGSDIWIEDDADDGEEVWMLAQVMRQENTLLTVLKRKTGEEAEIDLVSS